MQKVQNHAFLGITPPIKTAHPEPKKSAKNVTTDRETEKKPLKSITNVEFPRVFRVAFRYVLEVDSCIFVHAFVLKVVIEIRFLLPGGFFPKSKKCKKRNEHVAPAIRHSKGALKPTPKGTQTGRKKKK